MKTRPKVLSIAGVDPSGGAGVLADIKTMSALGTYGMAVVTALTAQNTQGVTGVNLVAADFVGQQLAAVTSDIRPDSIKIGMLATAEIVDVVADYLRTLDDDQSCVLDPVMVATSGDRLLDESAVAAVRGLLPIVSIITPNLPEAAVLLDQSIATTYDQMRQQALALLALGAPRVYLKAGHLTQLDQACDLYADADRIVDVSAAWVPTSNVHGTGCTLSSAFAALRPQRPDWLTTCQDAKNWLTGALQHADELNLGHGSGPVDHLWNITGSER